MRIVFSILFLLTVGGCNTPPPVLAQKEDAVYFSAEWEFLPSVAEPGKMKACYDENYVESLRASYLKCTKATYK